MAGCVLEEFEDCTYCKGSGICSDCKGSGRSLYQQPYIAKGQVYNKISHAYEDKYTIYAGSCYSCSGGGYSEDFSHLSHLVDDPNYAEALESYENVIGSGKCQRCNGTGRGKQKPGKDKNPFN
jgi:DnaJ-class molecular chaperone